MTLDDYQTAALRTINPALNDRDRLLDASAGLAEEAAELLGLVRKRVFQGRVVEEARLIEELGDVLWCLAVTSNALGIPLSRVARENQAKLRRRHPDGFTPPSARP
ncbi:MAG TPA: nucleoside triphosphate pyrophosphohydrolase family protein [Gemmatimonadaceae bacterium]|jgi:NTP pyrophosphatase (non-canonical NTP hydrolase)|nr:nucleoside triphosphate pyrophosphohydrolase family protein [Gemmatimonadaceae bacterium]